MAEPDTTSRTVLAGGAYANDCHLAARQSLYAWQRPSYDLPGIVLQYLPETAGVLLDVGCGNHVRNLHAAVAEAVRVLRPGGIMIASTNARDDKKELDELWAAAAAEVLNVERGPRRISLSNRFALDDAPALLGPCFAAVEVQELPSVITVNEPEPIVAYLGSYRAWADQSGVPFDDTLNRARSLVSRIIDRDGEFRITRRGGILVCRTPA